MKSLLDTCVVSELTKPDCHDAVSVFVSNLDPSDVSISVITIGELFKGIELLPAGRKKEALRFWLVELEKEYAHNFLSVNRKTVYLWASLTAKAQKAGKIIPASDGLIAATALEHGLTVVTRNVKDFEHAGAMVHNPWD